MKNVGDVVKIREDLEADRFYGGQQFCFYMIGFRGQIAKISKIDEDEEFYGIEGDVDDWAFTDEMFENIPSFQQLLKFKEYFDELYGKGLEIANWHQNGNMEPFDSFYESAIECMEK
jgi:hypothetical protein